MPLPQKRWFRMADVAERWSVKPTDLEDYALDELLQLSVFVVDLPAEAGTWEGGQSALHDLPILNGPQPLLRSSLLEVFRDGQAEVRTFRTEQPNTYLRIRSDVPSTVVRRDDCIVTREERDRFENEHAATSTPAAPLATAENWHNEDFTRVLFGGTWHKFGKKQAAVLQLLKAAHEKGEPWREAQQLLTEAKADSMRLVDLFRHKPVWRQLVETNGNGGYRLNMAMLSPEQRRIRLFRRSGTATRARVVPRPLASEYRTQSRVWREPALAPAEGWRRG
jgi:hypothetical protein